MKSYVLQCNRPPLEANHVPLVACVILLECVICFPCLCEYRHQPIPALHTPCTAWNITFISMICHFRCCPHLFLHNTCRASDGSAGSWHRRWEGICKCWGCNYWRFSTAWYGTVRHGSVRYGTAQFRVPLQFSTAIEWAGLFTRRYNCAASTAVTSS